MCALETARDNESSPVGKSVLSQIIENDKIAAREEVPLCQDTGMAVLFVEYGDRVVIEDGSFDEAVNEGVRRAYIVGYLRKSVVNDPVFDRINTKDNTPAIIHTKIVSGNQIKITAGGKGFGSENMSQIKMLTPSKGIEGVKQFILDTVFQAGPNPCPPMVVGVGIGGTFERAAQLAKKATFRCGKFFDVNCSGFYLNFFGIAVSIGSKCGKLAVTALIRMLMCHKVTHKKLIDNSPLFRKNFKVEFHGSHTNCVASFA